MTKSRTNADNVTADIAGITAGTGITGGGTSGTVTITNDMATTIAAKGDLLAGTANDAYSSITVGANGTTLVADSSQATGLKWQAPASAAPTSASNTVNTSQTTQSFDYTALTTAQAVTITTGTKALVLLTAQISSPTGTSSAMSFAVSGSTTIDISDDNWLNLIGQGVSTVPRATAVVYLTGLTAGSNTFTCQFRAVSGGGGTDRTFSKRNITVIDMGS